MRAIVLVGILIVLALLCIGLSALNTNGQASDKAYVPALVSPSVAANNAVPGANAPVFSTTPSSYTTYTIPAGGTVPTVPAFVPTAPGQPQASLPTTGAWGLPVDLARFLPWLSAARDAGYAPPMQDASPIARILIPALGGGRPGGPDPAAGRPDA